MELKTQKFLITDSKGEETNVKRKNIAIYLNGKQTPFSLRDLFGYIEFGGGEIYGNSLLSFYKVQEDGSLSVEGSIVQLFNADTNEFILVKEIKRPGMNDDTTISFEEVQKFAHDFSIEKPDEVFPDLNDEEKQVFIAEREKREAETTKQKAEAAKALQEAETARLEKEKEEQEIKAKEEAKTAAQQADKDLRAKVKPENIYYDKKYQRDVKDYYKKQGCNEYASGALRVWFGKASEEEPCLFIQRGMQNEAHGLQDWFEQPKQESFEGETPNELIIEFTDLGTERELVFNKETGNIKVKE